MRLSGLVILLAFCLAAPSASAMDMDDSLIGTVESIGGYADGSFFFTCKEYGNMYFKIPRATAIKYGIYDKSVPGGFNRQWLDTFEGRQVEVRVDREKGKRDWFVVKTFRVLK